MIYFLIMINIVFIVYQLKINKVIFDCLIAQNKTSNTINSFYTEHQSEHKKFKAVNFKLPNKMEMMSIDGVKEVDSLNIICVEDKI